MMADEDETRRRAASVSPAKARIMEVPPVVGVGVAGEVVGKEAATPGGIPEGASLPPPLRNKVQRRRF